MEDKDSNVMLALVAAAVGKKARLRMK